MSRRKQAKPQHLKSDEEAARTGLSQHGVMDGTERQETNDGLHSSEEIHICDKCCGEFFTWTELKQHHKVCTEDPLVLIVKDSDSMAVPEESPVGPSPVGPSPVPSVASSDSSAAESTEAGFETGDALANDSDSLDNLEEAHDEAMELEHHPQDKHTRTSSPQPPHSAESPCPHMSAAGSYGMPSTNVTLEILHSTRVAVAQFSQGIGSGGAGGKAASAAIPLILEHLLALQQQQVHQLQLIEQICSQVAVMNRQPTQAALNPVSRSLSIAPSPFPAHSVVPPPILPLSGTMPSTMNGQAAVSLSSGLGKSQDVPSQTACGQTCTSAGSESSTPSLSSSSSSSSSSSTSTLLPPYTGSHSSSHTLSSTSPLSLGQSSLLSSSSNLPFLPQSPPSSVIFPNPLASIAATANALDPLAALMKHRKGKLPSVSLFETKPGPEEPFFKHKCRFCAKVFGSDSALQIHLRSHTGERPFKCNICGNRFSTKGNLKVHFQRHKDKYPHVQMNPYPVPEYLDNVPTSSGIPYGMSIPPEKPVSSWLDNKPVVAALPATAGLALSSGLTGVGGSNDPVSVTASVRSPYEPAPAQCVSLSPHHRGSEAHFSPVSESPHSHRETQASATLRTEGVHLPQSCTIRVNPVTTATSTATPSPEPVTSASPGSNSPPLSLNSEETKLQPVGFLDFMETSETSKLQQLVENIDKQMTDPNQCVLCHRVLSCQSALKMHYRIHTGERPFKCKVCGRAFTTKGNLKTHVGVHRENPPVQVQHSCPICQKKFTNAVVLQQHIRMHMVGQIPDATLADGLQEIVTVNERSFDGLCSNGNDLHDDTSMEDDNEEEETETMEEVVSPSKSLVSDCNSPPRSSAASRAAALQNQLRMIDFTVSRSLSLGAKSRTNGFNDSSSRLTVKCASSDKRAELRSTNSPSVAESSASPVQSDSESAAASVKRERPESPTSASVCVKEESPYSVLFTLSRDKGQTPPSLITSASSIKAEVNGHSQPDDCQHPALGTHVSTLSPSAGSPGVSALLGPAPPRRTPKQHNCSACGKNFSSASALQIHERTHTGEKPFVCSICGRAFTTKGNLKVHMGTHMWNNAPARRGRRLSVENPMALLGGEAAKFGEMFQKDLAARAMNVDPGFWNRYATAITTSLAMKNNEMAVIQGRGLSQLHPLSAGLDRVNAVGSPITSLTKSGVDLGNSRHFSMLIDDSKEIGIN